MEEDPMDKKTTRLFRDEESNILAEKLGKWAAYAIGTVVGYYVLMFLIITAVSLWATWDKL